MEVLKEFLQNITMWQVVVTFGVISALVEKSKKLPFNPWSNLFNWVNKPVLQRLDSMEKQLKEFHADSDEKEAKKLRSNIMCFSDSCRVHEKHTKRHFENIFRDYDDYMELCRLRNLENHFLDEDMKYIQEVYQECQKENKFL